MFKSLRFVWRTRPRGKRDRRHLYYIVLEAVGNAIKHGKAKTSSSISNLPATFPARVKDDGIGFSQNDGKLTGMGIRSCNTEPGHRRDLTLQSRPGSGTDIACLFVPISGECG